jgi:hypothetical protein
MRFKLTSFTYEDPNTTRTLTLYSSAIIGVEITPVFFWGFFSGFFPGFF